MSRDKLSLFFDMDKLENVPARSNFSWVIIGFDLENRRITLEEYADRPTAPMEIAEYGLKDNVIRTRARTKRERLNDAKKGLEVKLKEINDAIAALDAHPELEKFMEVMEKAGI